MRPRDAAELVLLAALWGASFLFMRVGVPEFGPVALSAVRVAVASLTLLPLLALQGQLGALRTHGPRIALVGLLNSALPFLAFSFAALSISAGLSAIFNATTPLWGAAVAWLWFRERLVGWRLFGLALGFAGVVGLAWEKASFKPGADGPATGLAVLACVVATSLYAVAGHYARRRLAGAAPMAVAAGSQTTAALALALPAWWTWPATTPSAAAWVAVALLGVLSTGLAYLLYFRLIRHVGATLALSVTYLIPLFAMLWGGLFLGERPTATMVLGGLVIVAGTALASGWIGPRAAAPAAR